MRRALFACLAVTTIAAALGIATVADRVAPPAADFPGAGFNAMRPLRVETTPDERIRDHGRSAVTATMIRVSALWYSLTPPQQADVERWINDGARDEVAFIWSGDKRR